MKSYAAALFVGICARRPRVGDLTRSGGCAGEGRCASSSVCGARGPAWARSIAVAAACAAPAVASAQLTPSSTPLPGSTFQGADGDQLEGGGFVDWEGLETAGGVVHNEDPNAQDSTFAGGTKEGAPFEWTFENTPGGVTPGKSNIRDAWSAVDQTSGRTFLYLAFARDAPVGTTFLTFELNHVGGTWKNDKGVRVPCRA